MSSTEPDHADPVVPMLEWPVPPMRPEAWPPVFRELAERYGRPYHDGTDPRGWGFKANGHWLDVGRWDAKADTLIVEFAPSSVLDLGCGRGSLVAALVRRGIPAIGVDISEWCIANPVPDAEDRIHVGLAIDQLPRADLVVAMDILEHQPAEYIDQAIDQVVAAAGRCVYMTAPVIDGYPNASPYTKPASGPLVEHYIFEPISWWVEQFQRRGMHARTGMPGNVPRPYANFPLCFDRGR